MQESTSASLSSIRSASLGQRAGAGRDVAPSLDGGLLVGLVEGLTDRGGDNFMGSLGVTVAGAPLPHRLYHFRLAYTAASSTPMSCWAARASWRWQPGCRTRSGRSAACRASIAATASRRLPQSRAETRGGPDPPLRRALQPLRHEPQPQQPRYRPRERRDRERHGHLKRAIEDALLLRGSRDFDTSPTIVSLVDALVGRRHARIARRIDDRASRTTGPAEAAHRGR